MTPWHTPYGITVTRQRPTPAEIATMVEQGLARGMNLIDSFQAATGNRTLTKVHKKAAQEHRRIQREYAVRRDSIRFGAVGGAGAAVITGAAGALTLTPGWWILTGIGAVTSFISFRKWNSIGPAPRESAPVEPVKALPRGAIGKDDVMRYINVRTQILQMHSGIRAIHPDAAIELRAADSAAAPALNTLVERLTILHELRLQLPNTAAAHTAESAAIVISETLRTGCDSYDTLLAAAAKLMAAPGIDMNSNLQLAADALIAYSYGLERAADL
jgi:hypothetical protein